MKPIINSDFVQVEDQRIHYLSAGQGEVILLIHGFPTSAYLWRNIISGLASDYRVIAIDLPGYGKSDKKLTPSYSFRFYEKTISQFLAELKIDQITLGVHDFGGPVGLYWMVQNMDKVSRLILFNTLVYPQFSWAVKLFGLATMVPGVKNWLTSPKGIRGAMRFGVAQKENLTAEIIENYQAPFVNREAREVLLKSVQRLSIKGFHEIEQQLPNFKGPVKLIYGEADKILPHVAKTMERVRKDLPQADITSLPNCGHFLQEDEPVAIAAEVMAFMKR